MLEALDRKIIEKLTKFSHWFQKLTGLTCYFFAKMGICIAILGLFLRALNYFKPFLGFKTYALDLFFLFFFSLVFIRKIYLCDKAEENLFSSETIKVEKESYVFRMFCLFWCAFEVTGILPSRIFKTNYMVPEIVATVGFFMGLTIYHYFVEVTPLPPGKSKVRQWIEGLFASQPQLEPIPIKSDD